MRLFRTVNCLFVCAALVAGLSGCGKETDPYTEGMACLKSGKMTQAAQLFRQAADSGHADAMMELSSCYLNGTGVAKDQDAAYSWIKKAADAGSQKAKAYIAIFIMQGIGTSADEATGLAILEEESAAGNPHAAQLLASLVKPEAEQQTAAAAAPKPTGTLERHRQAAAEGNADSMYYLGRCYATGKEGVTKDQETAFLWYQKAAEAGSKAASGKMGACYLMGQGVATETTKGISLVQQAAAAGDPDSMHNLGVCYERGLGVSKNPAEAVKWYRKGAEAGCREAMYNLYVCLSKGMGVAPNPAEAEQWRRKAQSASEPLRGRDN